MEPVPKRQKLTLVADTLEQSSNLTFNGNATENAASHLSTSSIQHSQLTLLGVPIDLRMVIYDFVFGDARINMTRKIWHHGIVVKYNEDLRVAASILLVNKQIHNETLPFFEKMKITLVIASRRSMFKAERSIRTIPAKLQAHVTTVQLAMPTPNFNDWLNTPGVNLSKLGKISLCHRVCHFQEDARPVEGNPEIKKEFLRIMQKRYREELLTDNHWHPNNGMHQIDDVFVVWFLNTRRGITNGWEVKMNATNAEVISMTKKVFKERKFDKSSLGNGQTSAEEEREARLAWKYSPDGWSSTEGWWVNELDTGMN